MHELDLEVSKLAETPPIAFDFKFRDQIKDAANSAALPSFAACACRSARWSS